MDSQTRHDVLLMAKHNKANHKKTMAARRRCEMADGLGLDIRVTDDQLLAALTADFVSKGKKPEAAAFIANSLMRDVTLPKGKSKFIDAVFGEYDHILKIRATGNDESWCFRTLIDLT